MALVAYGSSSDSEMSETDISDVISNKTKGAAANSCPVNNEIVDSDDDLPQEAIIGKSNEVQNDILNVLPKPTKKKNYDDKDELEDIVKPKTTQMSDAPKPPSKKKRKIIVDISALNKDDSDEENPFFKSHVSKKSTLLSMLPSARGGPNTDGNKKLMVPHIVSSKPAKFSQPSKKTFVMTSNKSDNEDDDNDDDSGSCTPFFSFNKDNDLPIIKNFETSFIGPSWAQKKQEHESPVPEPEIQIGPSMPTQNERQTSSYPQVDDIVHAEEMKRIQGKNSSSINEANIIDVDTDSFIGDARANVMKNLTSDEDLALMDKVSKMKNPSGNEKRKHQITFLAHQAQVRELELKNQWATSRMNRQASRNKYGF